MKLTFVPCVVIVMTIFMLGAIYGAALSHGAADAPMFTNSATTEDLARFKASARKSPAPPGGSSSTMKINKDVAVNGTPVR